MDKTQTLTFETKNAFIERMVRTLTQPQYRAKWFARHRTLADRAGVPEKTLALSLCTRAVYRALADIYIEENRISEDWLREQRKSLGYNRHNTAFDDVVLLTGVGEAYLEARPQKFPTEEQLVKYCQRECRRLRDTIYESRPRQERRLRAVAEEARTYELDIEMEWVMQETYTGEGLVFEYIRNKAIEVLGIQHGVFWMYGWAYFSHSPSQLLRFFQITPEKVGKREYERLRVWWGRQLPQMTQHMLQVLRNDPGINKFVQILELDFTPKTPRIPLSPKNDSYEGERQRILTRRVNKMLEWVAKDPDCSSYLPIMKLREDPNGEVTRCMEAFHYASLTENWAEFRRTVLQDYRLFLPPNQLARAA